MFLRVAVAESEDLGFRVHPATFEFDLLAMLEFAYERKQFCWYLKDVPDQDPPAEVLAAEWDPTIRALEELVAVTGQDKVADPPPGGWGLERCVDPLVAERKYRAVHCPGCATAYAAGAVAEEDFGYEGRVVGGQRYACPEGHVLFAFVRFDARGSAVGPPSADAAAAAAEAARKIDFVHPTTADGLAATVTAAFDAGDKEALDRLMLWGDATEERKRNSMARAFFADMAGGGRRVLEAKVLPPDHGEVSKVGDGMGLSYALPLTEALTVRHGTESSKVTLSFRIGEADGKYYLAPGY